MGQVAMISQGSWMVSAFKDNEDIVAHGDVARLPKGDETGKSISMYNGLGWAASANTGMPDEAYKLIEWFGTKDMQQKQADLGVTMSAYEGVSDNWVNCTDAFHLQPYLDALEGDLVFRPHTNSTLAWWNIGIIDVWSIIGYNMVLFISGLQEIPGDYYEAAH